MDAINQIYMMDFRMYIKPQGSDPSNSDLWERDAVYVTNNDDQVRLDTYNRRIHVVELYVTFGSDVRKWYMYTLTECHHMDDIMAAYDILKETLENMPIGSRMFGHHSEPFTKIDFVNAADRDYYEARQLHFNFN